MHSLSDSLMVQELLTHIVNWVPSSLFLAMQYKSEKSHDDFDIDAIIHLSCMTSVKTQIDHPKK